MWVQNWVWVYKFFVVNVYNGSLVNTSECLSARIITITTCDNCVTIDYKPNWRLWFDFGQLLFVILPPESIGTKQQIRTARYLFEWHSICRHRIVYFVIHLTYITMNTTSMTIISKFETHFMTFYKFQKYSAILKVAYWMKIFEWNMKGDVTRALAIIIIAFNNVESVVCGERNENKKNEVKGMELVSISGQNHHLLLCYKM